VDIHALASNGIDLATGLAAAMVIDESFDPATSIRALQFYGDGTLDRIPEGMRRDLTRWAQQVDPGKLPALRSQRGLSPGGMELTVPYPADLLRIARKVVWYDQPEQRLAHLDTFLAHLMVYINFQGTLGRPDSTASPTPKSSGWRWNEVVFSSPMMRIQCPCYGPACAHIGSRLAPPRAVRLRSMLPQRS
jgi:hypothetical protein